MTKRWMLIGVLLISVLMAACRPAAPVASEGRTNSEAFHLEVVISDDVTLVTDDAFINLADAVFLGRVDRIGPTEGEADNPTHFVAVTVLDALVDEIEIGSGAILTLPGLSPLDHNATTGAMRPTLNADHQMQVGSEYVFFVQESVLQSPGTPVRPILTPLSPWQQSIIDGSRLDSVTVQIGRKWPLPVVAPPAEATDVY